MISCCILKAFVAMPLTQMLPCMCRGKMSIVKKRSVAITNIATTYTAGIAHDTHYHDIHTVPPTAVHE